jgi:uncharacterized membrane protein YkvA (DUF1232 family)
MSENTLQAVQPQPRTRRGKALAVVGVILSALFLLNFTMGIFEIPDNLPLVGNLDEVAATALLLACLRYLGLDVLPFKTRL